MEIDYDEILQREGISHTWTYMKIKCEIQRGGMGNWCGYVTVPKELAILLPQQLNVRVHGGITYDSNHADGSRVIGFDAAHSDDLIPYMMKINNFYPMDENKTYKDKNFMIEETTNLARKILFL